MGLTPEDEAAEIIRLWKIEPTAKPLVYAERFAARHGYTPETSRIIAALDEAVSGLLAGRKASPPEVRQPAPRPQPPPAPSPTPREEPMTAPEKITDNAAGYRGVSPAPSARNPWQSRIGVGGLQKHLGLFATPEEAARAYDRAIIEHGGDRSRLNFPDEHPEPEESTLMGAKAPQQAPARTGPPPTPPPPPPQKAAVIENTPEPVERRPPPPPAPPKPTVMPPAGFTFRDAAEIAGATGAEILVRCGPDPSERPKLPHPSAVRELRSMADVAAALGGLTKGTIRRVLAWAAEAHGVDVLVEINDRPHDAA